MLNVKICFEPEHGSLKRFLQRARNVVLIDEIYSSATVSLFIMVNSGAHSFRTDCRVFSSLKFWVVPSIQ